MLQKERLSRESIILVLAEENQRLERLHGKSSLLRLPKGKTRFEYAGSFLERVGAKPTRAQKLGDIIAEMLRRDPLANTDVETLITAVAVRPEFLPALPTVLGGLEVWCKASKANAFYGEDILEALLETVVKSDTEHADAVTDTLSVVRKLLPAL